MLKQEILQKTDIIILSKVRWDWQSQSVQKLTLWLSRYVRNVIFIENFPKRFPTPYELYRIKDRILGFLSIKKTIKYSSALIKESNISIVTPLVLPSINFIFNLLNRRLFLPVLIRHIKKAYGINLPLVFCFLPLRPSLDFIKLFKPKLLAYYCTDNFLGDPQFPNDVHEIEHFLIENADFVICSSNFLFREKQKIRNDIIEIPSSVDFSLFTQADNGMIVGPIGRVCYFGDINNTRIDFSIIQSIALNNIEVWLIGPVRNKIPKLPKNVKLFGKVEHDKLPGYLKDCDCLILPYKINELAKGILPAKIFECFASGKPIIATALPDLSLYNDVINIASTSDKFVEIIRHIDQYETSDKYEKRIKVAMEHSEDNQFSQLGDEICAKISNKEDRTIINEYEEEKYCRKNPKPENN